MSTTGAKQRITDVVTQWPGVEAGSGDRGAFSFTYRGREMGHLHGDHAAHFGFPRDLGMELHAAGRVEPHPVAPESVKMGSRRIRNEADEREVIELLRMNYDRLVARLAERDATADLGGDVGG